MFKVFNLKTKEIFEDVISIDHENRTFTWIDDDYSNVDKEAIELSLEHCTYVKQLGVDIHGQKIYEGDYVFVVAKNTGNIKDFNTIDIDYELAFNNNNKIVDGEFSKLNNPNHKYIKNNQLDSNYNYNLIRSYSPFDNIDVVSNSHGYDDVRQLRSRIRLGAMGTGQSVLSESTDSLLNTQSDILIDNLMNYADTDIASIYPNLNNRLDMLRNNGSTYDDTDISSLYSHLNNWLNDVE